MIAGDGVRHNDFSDGSMQFEVKIAAAAPKKHAAAHFLADQEEF
ncbi:MULTISPECIES: hypothetical protein [unclassified Mesorhizobium]|nr:MULTISPECIES: hypothetical protein [unclassified Mesorhizobium]